MIRYLLVIFLLGLAVGFAFTSPSPTGAAVNSADCYVDNELCECGGDECVCGEIVVSQSLCNLSDSANL